MKKILVPTDFSKNALNATRYAIQIANQFGSTIMLLHTYEVQATTGTFIAIENYIKGEAKKAMAALIEKIEPELKNGASLKSEIFNGSPISAIPRVAVNYDLVIMGTQGATGLLETFIGSTTSGVINRCKKPVLVIPNKAEYKPLSNIVFALDNLDIKSLVILEVLLALAQKSKAHINFYHLDETGDSDGIDPTVEDYFEGVKKSFYYEINKRDLNKSINKFVAKKDAELLCMLRRKRSSLENLLHRSATKKEVFDSPVPVLILQEP